MPVSPPWVEIPDAVAPVLAPVFAGLTDELISTIGSEVPAYARPLEGAFGEGVYRGVEEALRRFLELVRTRDPAGDRGRDVYVELGRGEVRQGRSLDALLAAFRVGARVVWRASARAATQAHLGSETLVVLGEAIFAYIDEISAAAAEGYALEQSVTSSERDRLRAELAALLLSGRANLLDVEATARSAGWTPPRELVAVIVPSPAAAALALHLSGLPGAESALLLTREGTVTALLPAPPNPRRRAQVSRALAGFHAVVGPSRPWTAVSESAARAALAQALLSDGVLPPADPLFADEHLLALLLHRDAGLLADLAARRLAPLRDLPEATADRLAETLLAWLRHRGERQAAAAALHVHPQTVRYRLGQLRERFGPALDDPDVRFELEVVLRAKFAARA